MVEQAVLLATVNCKLTTQYGRSKPLPYEGQRTEDIVHFGGMHAVRCSMHCWESARKGLRIAEKS